MNNSLFNAIKLYADEKKPKEEGIKDLLVDLKNKNNKIERTNETKN